MSVRRTLDPEGTRDQILSAALSCFSERGFSATSIRGIAETAGVPKSLVLYHYASKENLWVSAIHREAQPLVAVMQRYADGDANLTLRDLLRIRFNLLRQHPKLSRLLAWMSLEAAPLPSRIQEL